MNHIESFATRSENTSAYITFELLPDPLKEKSSELVRAQRISCADER